MTEQTKPERIQYAREARLRAERLRDLMISVATGGQSIDAVRHTYRSERDELTLYLDALGIPDPNPYDDLWRWYGKWSSGDLPTYQSRRMFIADLFGPLLERLRAIAQGREVIAERPVTGWVLVDRRIEGMRSALEQSRHVEDYQAIGLRGREALISLAQAVYIREKHPPIDGTEPSSTDAKRMLEAFIASEMSDGTNELIRKHARSVVDLANELTHKQTATFRLTALCAEAVSSAVNTIAIVSGRRDPTDLS